MSFATIADLRANLGGRRYSEAYAAKMLHPFPEGEIVDRIPFITAKVKDKVVLDFGASGELHQAIVAAAKECVGIDREDGDGVIGFDLDDITEPLLPPMGPPEVTFQPDVIVCGEVLEHLSNPGWFLTRLKAQYPGVPVIVSVPNGLCSAAQKHLKDGRENVNIDHVAWYSPRTLRTLLDRVGYTIQTFAYYNGDGPKAEGLIAEVL